MSNEVKFKLTATETVTKKLNGVSRAFDKLGGKGSGASLFGNIGAKAVAKGFDLVGMAASGAVGFLQDSVSAAREAQVSEANLAQSLKNNVPAWDGTTDAIERQLDANKRLGFSDETQRDVFAKLLAVTHDQAGAFDILTASMDVARFKHIDLDSAAGLVRRALNGNKKALQELGIELPKNATKEQRLAAVMGVVTGAADTYAGTLDGKVDAANIKLQDAQEALGKRITPILTEAVMALSDAFDFFSGDPRKHATGALGAIEDAAIAAYNAVDALLSALDRSNDYPKAHGAFSQPNVPGHAEGGWVGMRGPELAMVGEKGPEYIVPNHRLSMGRPSGSGVTIQGVTERQIVDMVERGLYFRLQRAGTGR